MQHRPTHRLAQLLGLIATGVGLLLPLGPWTTEVAARHGMVPRATMTGNAVPLPLGPIPSNCQNNPPPESLPHALGDGIGMSPVWAVGFTPGLTLHLDFGDKGGMMHGPHGWYRKLAWLIGPDYRQRIVLRGSALAGGAPLWFQIGGNQPPTTTPLLNPQQPEAEFPGEPPGWAFFPSYMFIPRAGCYVVEASWPGGMWRLAFAAGR